MFDKDSKDSVQSRVLREKALVQLRETRRKMLREHPLWMARLARLIQPSEPIKPEPWRPEREESREHRLDPRHNLSAVLQYLEIKQGEISDSFRARVISLLPKPK